MLFVNSRPPVPMTSDMPALLLGVTSAEFHTTAAFVNVSWSENISEIFQKKFGSRNNRNEKGATYLSRTSGFLVNECIKGRWLIPNHVH